MGTFQYKGQGVRSVGAYQVSGTPFITGSGAVMAVHTQRKVPFPTVTKSITVINSGSGTGQLLVHFNDAHQAADAQIATGAVTGSAHHYVTLNGDGDSVTFNVKCKEIYLTARHGTAGFELFAELTGIPTSSMFRLTGSGLTSTTG